jgi:hypothetical protein
MLLGDRVTPSSYPSFTAPSVSMLSTVLPVSTRVLRSVPVSPHQPCPPAVKVAPPHRPPPSRPSPTDRPLYPREGHRRHPHDNPQTLISTQPAITAARTTPDSTTTSFFISDALLTSPSFESKIPTRGICLEGHLLSQKTSL